MAEHTPGPWILYADLPSIEPNWHIVTTNNKLRVLANVLIEPDNAMDEANARLITAAPDLLSSAEALLVAWQKVADALPQHDVIEDIEIGEFQDLRAAVAKAQGIHSWEVHKHLFKTEEQP